MGVVRGKGPRPSSEELKIAMVRAKYVRGEIDLDKFERAVGYILRGKSPPPPRKR